MDSMLRVLPRLRHVETFPIEAEGRKMIAIKDPQRYATAMLTVEPAALYVLARCDGRTTMDALAHQYKNETGQQIPMQAVESLIRTFDDYFFLDTPKFQERRRRVNDAWKASEVRPSALFDYADTGEAHRAWQELRALLDHYFLSGGYDKGPDIRPEFADLYALVAPHIDYQRGGKVWAIAYAELARRFAGGTLIIVGTNHQPHRSPISITRKDFATPFGVVEVDQDLVDEIAAALPIDPFDDEMPHRVEHSIELPAVMLAYLERDIKIVPILVGSSSHLIGGAENDEADEAFAHLAEVLANIVRESDGEVAMIASADLAHVGPMFDDPFKIDDAKALTNKERDLDMLTPLFSGEVGGFVEYIAEEKDVRKVCGLSPISIVGAACEGLPFDLLAHDQWVDPEGQGLVSYAALIAKRPNYDA
ncbi:MAG: AmmeMemoRadiSam system protein B [Deltaproteobacteria bacterium]|nr:AmmeMemoRadiSam system protein B [Deltaproteobacteria bacterium]MCB9487724.1 AmmeMemoRadiSam system protein B [Deltaproteobacteria bacterium]